MIKAMIKIVEKSHIIIAIILAFILISLTWFEIIKKTYNISSDIISVMAVVIGVYGIYIGVVISLQESNLFKRIRNELNINIEEKLFLKLRNQMAVAVLVIVYSLGIKIVPSSGNILIDMMGLLIWYFLIFEVFINVLLIIVLFTNISKKQNKSVPRREMRS